MADVVLQITIPDVNVARVLAAITILAGKNIMLEAENVKGTGETNRDFLDWRGRISYSYAVKGGVETNRDFAVRAVRSVIIAMVRMVDLAEDEERYRAAVAAVPQPLQDVPDNIIT